MLYAYNKAPAPPTEPHRLEADQGRCCPRTELADTVLYILYMKKGHGQAQCFGIVGRSSPKVIKLFSCSTQLSMKFSLLIDMKMPTISYLLAEKFSCSAMFSKKEFAIVSSFRLISRANFVLSWIEHEKKFYNLGAGVLFAIDFSIRFDFSIKTFFPRFTSIINRWKHFYYVY